MRLERSHFFIENAIQVEKLIVEEKTNKIYKKKYTVDVSLQQYFKKVLAMTGTDAFIVFSSEDLEQTSGGLAVWEDGYIIENLLPIWGKGTEFL